MGIATEAEARDLAVKQLLPFEGATTGSAGHKRILEIYNSHQPRPRGLKMTTSLAWCAATVSVPGILLGWTDISPVECSCNAMIKLYKAHPHSKWVDEPGTVAKYLPKKGDIAMYDLNSNGVVDHTGMVIADFKAGDKYVVVLEGNYSKSVKRRSIALADKRIYGYCCPAYHLKVQGAPVSPPVPTPTPTPPVTDTPKEEVKVVRYNTISEVPEFGKATIRKLVNKGLLTGYGNKDEAGEPMDLDISHDMLRLFVINDRAGLYD